MHLIILANQEPGNSYRKRFFVPVLVSLVMCATSVDCCRCSFLFLSRRGFNVG